MIRRSPRRWTLAHLALLVVGCAGEKPPETVVTVIPPAAPSASATAAPSPTAAGMPTASAPFTASATPKTITCKQARTHYEGGTAVGNMLGIAAPAEPTRAKVQSHVRREAATSASPSLAQAVDTADYDTLACRQLSATKRNTAVDLDVRDGVIRSVTRHDDADEHLQCLMTAFCDTKLTGKPTGTATVMLHQRPMDDRPAVKATKGTADADQLTMIEVMSEAAAACEQGQLLGSKPTTRVVGVGASPHSSVAPTMSIGFKTKGPMDDCIDARVDGYRLPLSPWTQVQSLDISITWDG